VGKASQHLSDDVLSALLDDQLPAADARAAREHLGVCQVCEQRLSELRGVVELLQALPEVALPRDFAIGPRTLPEPASVVRLRRWYAWTRVGAASLAAVFVLLVGSTVYLDSVARPIPSQATSALEQPPAAPQVAFRPEPARPTAASESLPARAAAPTSQRAAAPAASPEASDQVAAGTESKPLPTPTPPPPTPISELRGVAAKAVASAPDPAAPLRVAASLVGVLAALVLLGAVVVRHRLRRAESTASIPPEE
jgi:hypothetical protein